MSDLFWAGLRLAVTLPLVLLLCYLVLRYALPKCMAGFGSGRRMRVVEQLPMGPKASLTLVRVGDRYYLLAHQDGSVVVVKEYDELPETIGNEDFALQDAKPLSPLDPLFKRLASGGTLRKRKVWRG
ncbi:MAG: flagellar biosynthetic protein FliO [Eubacteriales bacterium]|nr:flagellar biosynthetic protein FliO [Bacillota bacterium]MBV1727736.1 flagellar biosynthetic protein FliO [Desulforudis sp.]MDP3050810.1 flagellar biosynthetic protein FliO [Eubacteriales bacterium]MBU4532798.1 flagellar biosynthetic protein FliO [Bacillota bacterium]MBU4554126.1 flagellar biosynthetic protein FliO [Bacillota bacterium]